MWRWLTAIVLLGLAGCVARDPGLALAPPGAVPMQAPPPQGPKRIAANGAGGYTLPDGTSVPADSDGGFTLPNGAHVAPDGAGGVRLPNGTRCTADGAGGYICP